MGCYCAFVQSTRTASASTVNTLYNLSLWIDHIPINIPQFAHSTLQYTTVDHSILKHTTVY